MTREDMINKVVRTRGFESKWTIWFCEMAEKSWSLCTLAMFMDIALNGNEEEFLGNNKKN